MFPPPLAIFPHLARRRQAARNFLAARSGLLICALFLLVGLDLAGDYGWGLDEAYQRRIAQANWDYLRGRAASVATPLAHERVYGAAFELPLLLLERALRLEDYYQIHRLRLTLIHLFFIIGGYFCYLLAYRLFNNRLLALFALLFFLLHPRIYGHSFFNAKDLPFLALFSIALYLLERAFRRDTLGAFLLLGIAVGLLTNLRIMGIMLLPAVIALRGLDWLYAADGPERKQILLTAALFLLTAAFTLYAVTPYAWANPVDYLTASLDLTINHPNITTELFQGQRFDSDQTPPHYAVTWFSITTPPLLLLLGGGGAVAIAARGLRRPGAAFRNNGLRLQLLLLACCLLPPLAAALLDSNLFTDWRHFYFLYAPFCLLAAIGLRWLTAARFPRRLGPAGGYALTAAGLGLLLLQITQLHPLPRSYFNFLVDRTTPEYLRTQYPLGYWYLGRREALEYLLQRHPDETLTVRAAEHYWDLAVLPPAERERLRPAGGRRQADYELIEHWHWDNPARPDLAFSPHYLSLYNNRIIGLRPLKAARMTPAALAAYAEIYRQARAGDPIIHADYTVYRQGQRLTFVKENCPPDRPDAWFAVSSYPPPPQQAKAAAPSWGNNGVRLDNLCLAVLQLPAALRGDVVLSQSDLGKFRPAGPVWQQLYSLDPPGLRERINRLRQKQPPAAANAFAVFLDQDPAGRYRLLYAKSDCAPAEYETPTFLRITPENRAALPFPLWASGIANREFPLSRYGVRSGRKCLAVVPLPDYPIAAIHTGQGGIWEKSLYPPADPEELRAAHAALADRQPNAQSTFALYIEDNRLVYVRETCAATDTAANFFLHIIPAAAADLPAERQAAGFANRDFAFARYGGLFDGNCLAAVPLPDYPIKSLRTGQFVPGQGELWAAELPPVPYGKQ